MVTFGGVVKVSIKYQDILKGKSDSIDDLAAKFSEIISLEGDIMLSLHVSMPKSDLSVEKALNHSLYLQIRGKRSIQVDGKKIDYLARSGVHIPEYIEIGDISFTKPEGLVDLAIEQGDSLLLREDEEWGTVYASYNQVSRAYDRLCSAIEDMEKTKIDLKKTCPEAKTDTQRKIIISVADTGYFNNFRHDKRTRIPQDYSTDPATKLRQMTFIPATFFLPKEYNRKLAC